MIALHVSVPPTVLVAMGNEKSWATGSVSACKPCYRTNYTRDELIYQGHKQHFHFRKFTMLMINEAE